MKIKIPILFLILGLSLDSGPLLAFKVDIKNAPLKEGNFFEASDLKKLSEESGSEEEQTPQRSGSPSISLDQVVGGLYRTVIAPPVADIPAHMMYHLATTLPKEMIQEKLAQTAEKNLDEEDKEAFSFFLEFAKPTLLGTVLSYEEELIKRFSEQLKPLYGEYTRQLSQGHSFVEKKMRDILKKEVATHTEEITFSFPRLGAFFLQGFKKDMHVLQSLLGVEKEETGQNLQEFLNKYKTPKKLGFGEWLVMEVGDKFSSKESKTAAVSALLKLRPYVAKLAQEFPTDTTDHLGMIKWVCAQKERILTLLFHLETAARCTPKGNNKEQSEALERLQKVVEAGRLFVQGCEELAPIASVKGSEDLSALHAISGKSAEKFLQAINLLPYSCTEQEQLCGYLYDLNNFLKETAAHIGIIKSCPPALFVRKYLNGEFTSVADCCEVIRSYKHILEKADTFSQRRERKGSWKEVGEFLSHLEEIYRATHGSKEYVHEQLASGKMKATDYVQLLCGLVTKGLKAYTKLYAISEEGDTSHYYLLCRLQHISYWIEQACNKSLPDKRLPIELGLKEKIGLSIQNTIYLGIDLLRMLRFNGVKEQYPSIKEMPCNKIEQLLIQAASLFPFFWKKFKISEGDIEGLFHKRLNKIVQKEATALYTEKLYKNGLNHQQELMPVVAEPL